MSALYGREHQHVTIGAMVNDAIFAVWFLLPVGAANLAPIFAAIIPGLKHLRHPIDGGRSWRGQPIFGPHKTWLGLGSGMVAATLMLGIQQWLYRGGFMIGSFDYSAAPLLLLGPLFGLGALGGDAIESFFKRQRKIPSGQAWVPFDQLDYIIGGVIVSLPFVILSLRLYLLIFMIWFAAHIVASYIGYRLGLKERPI